MAYTYKGTPARPKPAKKRGRPRSENTDCGTTGGYNRHRIDGTPKCLPCRAANAKACQENYQKRKQSDAAKRAA